MFPRMARRRSRVFAPALLALVLIAVSALLAGSSRVRAATGTTTVFIVPSGYGDISVDGAGAPYTCTNDLYAGSGCSLSVPTGTTLTFTATPKPVAPPEAGDPAPNPPVSSEFRGWSRPECGASGPCTVKTAADEEWVVAQFSPVWLEAVVAGSGTIEAGGVTRACTDARCVIGPFSSGTPVTVTARPATPGDATTWGFGCDPYASDLGNGRCVVQMSNVRNFVSVGFGGAEPDPSPPFNLSVNLAVERSGDGDGQVQGNGPSADLNAGSWNVDCGSACAVRGLQFQTQVRLRAVAGTDSEFERWAGPPCLTSDTCTFTVGKYPKVVAVFRKKAAPTPTPTPTPSPTPTPTPTPTPAAFKAAVQAAVTGTGRTRAVVVRLTTNRSARAALRLLRQGRTLGRKNVRVAAGTSQLRVPVGRTVKPGWIVLSAVVVDANGTTRTFGKRLRLGT